MLQFCDAHLIYLFTFFKIIHLIWCVCLYLLLLILTFFFWKTHHCHCITFTKFNYFHLQLYLFRIFWIFSMIDMYNYYFWRFVRYLLLQLVEHCIDIINTYFFEQYYDSIFFFFCLHFDYWNNLFCVIVFSYFFVIFIFQFF